MRKKLVIPLMILGLLAGSFLVHKDVKAAADIKISSTNFPDKIFRKYVRKFDDNEILFGVRIRNEFCIRIRKCENKQKIDRNFMLFLVVFL